MEFEVNILDDLSLVAKKIVELIPPHKIFLLDGTMGAGKTTLTGYIGKEIGIEDEVSSPTFGIVNTYFSDKYGNINHFDFYRLKDENEAIESGLDDLLYSGDICLIEWGEKIQKLLPDNYVRIAIEIIDTNRRKITITE